MVEEKAPPQIHGRGKPTSIGLLLDADLLPRCFCSSPCCHTMPVQFFGLPHNTSDTTVSEVEAESWGSFTSS